MRMRRREKEEKEDKDKEESDKMHAAAATPVLLPEGSLSARTFSPLVTCTRNTGRFTVLSSSLSLLNALIISSPPYLKS